MRNEKDEAHRALMKREKSEFEIDFVVQHRAPESATNIEAKTQILLEIAAASGMVYVCPQCVDKDYRYFNRMDQFRDHCRANGDEIHMDLSCIDKSTFPKAYIQAMGYSHVEDLPDLPFGKKTGPPSGNMCLKIDYVLLKKK